jgi:hypothetical protein
MIFFLEHNAAYFLNENVNQPDIKNILIKRISFLKEYDIEDRENELLAERDVFNENVKIMQGDKIIVFPQLNITSKVTYFPQRINQDTTILHFNVTNKFYPDQPKQMNDIQYRIFILAMKKVEEKLSYAKEVVLETGEKISSILLDQIINDINGVLFKIEDYTQTLNIDLF